MQAQVSLLRRKYAGRKVDLVIASLSSALDFALKYRTNFSRGSDCVRDSRSQGDPGPPATT